jgi:hypothetical protein
MFIPLTLPDGSPIWVNTRNITFFAPHEGQSEALTAIIHFTDGTSITVAQNTVQIKALVP